MASTDENPGLLARFSTGSCGCRGAPSSGASAFATSAVIVRVRSVLRDPRGDGVISTYCVRHRRAPRAGAEYYLVLVTVVLGGAMVDFFIQLVTGHQRKLLTQSRTWALLFFLLLLFLVLIASARTRRLDSSRGTPSTRGHGVDAHNHSGLLRGARE